MSNRFSAHGKKKAYAMAGVGTASDRPAIPSDLLGDDPQPSGPADWDAVVLRAATAYPLGVNRETLHFAVAVAAANRTNFSDVGRRYVRRYLRRLTAGFSGDRFEFAVWRGLVCELSWTTRGATEAVAAFRAAVGDPGCDNWSVIPDGIKQRVAAAVEASPDRRDWRTFPPNVCAVGDDDRSATRIQRRLCGTFPASLRLTCTSEPDSPPWCGTCEIKCYTIVGFVSLFAVFFVAPFVVLLLTQCVRSVYDEFRKWKNVRHRPIHR